MGKKMWCKVPDLITPITHASLYVILKVLLSSWNYKSVIGCCERELWVLYLTSVILLAGTEDIPKELILVMLLFYSIIIF